MLVMDTRRVFPNLAAGLLLAVVLVAVNLYLSLSPWSELKGLFFWVTELRQQLDIKLRHFVQFVPQTLLMLFVLEKVVKLSARKAFGFTFGFMLVLCVMSELFQILIPSRLANPMDVFWNVWATLIGLAIYKLAFHHRDRMEHGLVLFVVGTFVFLRFHEALAANSFFYDDIRVLSAGNNPGSRDWSYWWGLFTSPNHLGVQYRPLSYFGFTAVVSRFFTITPASAVVLAMLLVTLNATVLYRICKKMAWDSRLISWLVIAVFVLHPYMTRQFFSLSDTLKYLTTLGLLLFGFQLSMSATWRIRHCITIFALQTLAIGFHEGAIVFPALFCLIQWYFKSARPQWSWLILFVPGCVYLAVRFLGWGIPDQGFMAVNIWKIPENIHHYVELLFLTRGWGSPVLFGVGALLVALSVGLRDKVSWVFLISIFLLILPFTVLKAHQRTSHLVWAVPMYALFLGQGLHLLSRVMKQNNINRWHSVPGWIAAACVLVFVFWGNDKALQYEMEENVLHEMAVENFKGKVEKLLSGIRGSEVLEVKLIQGQTRLQAKYDSLFTAEVVAWHFPGARILFHAPAISKQIWIENGVRYSIASESESRDVWETKDPHDQAWSKPRPPVVKSGAFMETLLTERYRLKDRQDERINLN